MRHKPYFLRAYHKCIQGVQHALRYLRLVIFPFVLIISFKYRVKVVHSQLLLMQILDYAESDLQARDPKAEIMMFMNQKGVDDYIKNYSPENEVADVSTELLLAFLKLNIITFIIRPVTSS